MDNIPQWTIDGDFVTKDAFMEMVYGETGSVKMFKCRHCQRKFAGHPILEDIIYRVDDDCAGTVEDLEPLMGVAR
jgi:hypothetical protein